MMTTAISERFLSREFRRRWQDIQESFSRITGLSIWTLEPEGQVVGQPSSPPSICLLLRRNKAARAICNEHCIRHCQTAMKGNVTVFFKCHADLECFAAPLRSGGRPIGVILGGQVLTGSPAMEKYRDLARRSGIAEKDLVKAVSRLTIGSDKVLRQAADFITGMAELVFSGWDVQSRFARKLSLLTSLFNISASLSPKMDIHEIYAMILNSLSILFDIDHGALLLPDPADGGWKVRSAFGPAADELMNISISADEGLIQKLYSSASSSSDDYYLLLRAGFPEAVKQLTFFPLFDREELKGILAVFNHPLEDDVRKTITHFANQVSTTIQSAFLREQLRKKVDALSSMARLNEKFSSTMEMDELLDVIFEEASRLAGAERSSLMLLNEQAREMTIKLVRGPKEKVLKDFAVPMDDGLAGQVAKVGEPLLVKNLEKDARFKRPGRAGYKTNSFVILPLKAAGRIVGVLNVADKITGELYDEEDLELLRSLATQATVALERSELFERSQELRKISITDPLTAPLNRRYFQERALEELDRSRRYGEPLSLVMIDVDDFKHYNDRHGHLAGDAVLKGVGSIIKSMVRNVDVVSRFGGEEFAVLSPSTGKARALQIAERVRQGVAEYIFSSEREQPGGDLTISAGTATFPGDAVDLEELINNADKALYQAKRSGKNVATSYHKGL